MLTNTVRHTVGSFKLAARGDKTGRGGSDVWARCGSVDSETSPPVVRLVAEPVGLLDSTLALVKKCLHIDIIFVDKAGGTDLKFGVGIDKRTLLRKAIGIWSEAGVKVSLASLIGEGSASLNNVALTPHR